MLISAISSNRFFRLQCPLRECIPVFLVTKLCIFYHTSSLRLRMNYEKCLQGICFPGWSGSSLSAANFSRQKTSVLKPTLTIYVPQVHPWIYLLFMCLQDYCFHIRFFLNAGMWCTNVHKDMSVCKVVLVFQGKKQGTKSVLETRIKTG